MALDSDYALFGTGIAPLIAARRLMERGFRVILVNPEVDYFIEDTELPLDLLLPSQMGSITRERLQRNMVDSAFELLSPEFPGPVSVGLRARQRFWVQTPSQYLVDWDRWYLQLADWGLKPEIHDPHWIPKRFPGYSSPNPPSAKAISLQKMADVPLEMFRSALLEFVRERAGPERVLCGVNQVQLMPYGMRFLGPSGAQSALVSKGLWVFWTPRLEVWVKGLMKEKRIANMEPPPWMPVEEWSILSKEHTVEDVVGQYEDALIWSQGSRLIKVLRAGSPHASNATESAESYDALRRLTHAFLGWDRMTVRNLSMRYLYDWEQSRSAAHLKISHGDLQSYLLTKVDGPLTEIVHQVRTFVESHI